MVIVTELYSFQVTVNILYCFITCFNTCFYFLCIESILRWTYNKSDVRNLLKMERKKGKLLTLCIIPQC